TADPVAPSWRLWGPNRGWAASPAAATSDGTSGLLPYLMRSRSPFSDLQSNFGAVPPSSVISKVQVISFAFSGSMPSSARAIGGGAIQIDARVSASIRSSGDTVFDFTGFFTASVEDFACGSAGLADGFWDEIDAAAAATA